MSRSIATAALDRNRDGAPVWRVTTADGDDLGALSPAPHDTGRVATLLRELLTLSGREVGPVLLRGPDVVAYGPNVSPPEPADLSPCGPVSPRTDHVWPLTPTRRRLLAEVYGGSVYAEGGQAYHVDGGRRTGRIIEAIQAGWVAESSIPWVDESLPQSYDTEGRRGYALTDAGREALGGDCQ